MLNNEDIEIQNIDHLGIVAGIIDAIGLVETINELIGEEKGEKVSPGHEQRRFLSKAKPAGLHTEQHYQHNPTALIPSPTA